MSWIANSMQDVARFFGVSTTTIKDWRGKGMPGNKGAYPLDEIAQWKIRYEQQRASRVYGGSDEDLFGGGIVSPELERFRAARADLAEMEVQRKRGESVPREQMYRTLSELATILRQTGDTMKRSLCRNCSGEARDLLDEALTDWERRMEEKLAGDDDGLEADGPENMGDDDSDGDA